MFRGEARPVKVETTPFGLKGVRVVDRVEEIERRLAASPIEEHRAEIPDIVVDAGAGPDGHLPVAERVPCKTNSRAEGVQGRVVAPDRAGNRPLRWASPIGRGDVSNLPVAALELRRNRAKLISESQVQRQPGYKPVIVLNVEPKSALSPNAGLGGRERASQCLHVAVDSLGQIRKIGKGYSAPVVEMAILRNPELIDQCTELERVLSLGPVKVVAVRVNVVDVLTVGRNESQACHGTCRSEAAHVLTRLKDGLRVSDPWRRRRLARDQISAERKPDRVQEGRREDVRFRKRRELHGARLIIPLIPVRPVRDLF